LDSLTRSWDRERLRRLLEWPQVVALTGLEASASLAAVDIWEKARTAAMVAEILRKREEILQIARRHGVGRVRVFGSHARGSAGPSSDVDFLIEVDGPTTPWFPGGLVVDVEALLGCRVDVAEPDGLRPEMRARVLAEALPL
jgi:predicted nucleotidyltransferase